MIEAMTHASCPTCHLQGAMPPTYTSVQRCPRCFAELPEPSKEPAPKQAQPQAA
jgi:hypothetical protein